MELLIIGVLFAALFFGGAIWAFQWAAKHGQFDNLERGSRVIFDEDEEPEGVQTDYFPDKKARREAQKREGKRSK